MTKQTKKSKCSCPFCDTELVAKSPICQVCQVTILYCADCGKPLPRNKKTCPACGAKVKK
ncbi:MAG: zinc ribbon domain-containing protein [Dehalococcoidales bacterium]|nr:zinc ribbon domain-containing protein [Dehalococcoidales bacterium]